MKTVFLLIIKIYWIVIPKDKRRRCIFRKSCSQHVFEVSKKEGFYKGLKALRYRFQNCRAGFHILENPIDGSRIMILPNHQIIAENEISERFIN